MSGNILQFTEAFNLLSFDSNQKVSINCALNSAIKCQQLHTREYTDILQNMSRNDGQYRCTPCTNFLKFLGRETLNYNYHLDDSFLSNINTERKAYILGLIANYVNIREDGFDIKTNKENIEIIKHLSNIFYNQFTLKQETENIISLSINSSQLSNDILRHLNNEKDVLQFPDLENEQLKLDFIRGYFDSNGSINIESNQTCIYNISSNILEYIKNFIKIPFDIYTNEIRFNSTNSIDFLAKLYKNANIYLHRNYYKFTYIAHWKKLGFRISTVSRSLPTFKYTKTCEEALPPAKNRFSDSGYDLHLMRKIKEKNGVHYYDTCIKVQPEPGYYFDLVGRSSISKTGWTLANNVGIIDCTYSGSIIVALIKTRENADELVLPCKLVQIIPRNLILMEAKEVSDLDETERHESGGLGSGQFTKK